MENRLDSGAAVIVISLIFILLLVAGGVGVYYFVQRQQMLLTMQAERALMAEQMARAEAEQARAQAEAAAAARAALTASGAPAADGEAIRSAVEAILRAQEEAWNRGDLAAFLEHYWKSDDLTFSSEGKTARGWTQTEARYREKYPTPEKMGRLKLGGLEITPLGDSAALVLGTWNVERDSEPLSGNFSLVVRKLGGQWRIVHDHTSRTKE